VSINSYFDHPSPRVAIRPGPRSWTRYQPLWPNARLRPLPTSLGTAISDQYRHSHTIEIDRRAFWGTAYYQKKLGAVPEALTGLGPRMVLVRFEQHFF